MVLHDRCSSVPDDHVGESFSLKETLSFLRSESGLWLDPEDWEQGGVSGSSASDMTT